MKYLLNKNQIISHSVNKSEMNPALSEIAKFISLSTCIYKSGVRGCKLHGRVNMMLNIPNLLDE